MAEQFLRGADVIALFEQMGGKGVSEGVQEALRVMPACLTAL